MDKSTMKFIALFWCLMPLRVVGQDAHEFQHVTIEGNQIAWSCEGQGEPTVVLVAGMGLDAHASFNRNPWLVIDEIESLLGRVSY
jgi:hypothetical protein